MSDPEIKLGSIKIVKASGLLITLSSEAMIRWKNEFKEKYPEADYSDVRVKIDDIEVSMTWEEFKGRILK